MHTSTIQFPGIITLLFFSFACYSTPVIYINQIGFDTRSSKIAIIGADSQLAATSVFNLVNTASGKAVFAGKLNKPQSISEWALGKLFYQADFSSFQTSGSYQLTVTVDGKIYHSTNFVIEVNALAKLTISSIVHYYNRQRANTPEELAADKNMLLYGSTKRVDVHGGWCDASGDVSKYFSHLAYANFVSPQQTPLITWSFINTSEAIPKLLNEWAVLNEVRMSGNAQFRR